MELIINKHIIQEPIESILFELKKEANWNVFKDMQKKDDYVRITCPFHKNGEESHPSCSVYTSYDSSEILPGTFHCFTCGETGTLYQLVAHVLGISEEDGKQWLVDKFGDLYDTSILKFETWDIEQPKTVIPQYLDESILDAFNFYHPYIEHRKISFEVARYFRVGFNKDKNTITFPVWDEYNHLVMITERSITNKNYYIQKDVKKPVYLLNFIKRINNLNQSVIICESQINALTAWSYGYPAVALLGTGTQEQYDSLKRSGIHNFILCFDGDNAGRKGAARFKSAFKNLGCYITDVIMPDGKDLNDLSKLEFDSLLKNTLNMY